MDEVKQKMLDLIAVLIKESAIQEEKQSAQMQSDARALMVINEQKEPVPVRANEIRKLSDLRLVELVDSGRTLELISAGGKGVGAKEAAKVLNIVAPNMGPNLMYAFLRRVGDFYVEKPSGNTLPKQPLCEAGFYRYTWEINHQPTGPAKYARIYFTAKGINRIRKLYEKYGIIKLTD